LSFLVLCEPLYCLYFQKAASNIDEPDTIILNWACAGTFSLSICIRRIFYKRDLPNLLKALSKLTSGKNASGSHNGCRFKCFFKLLVILIALIIFDKQSIPSCHDILFRLQDDLNIIQIGGHVGPRWYL
jgi:hypothetical protein